MRYTLAIVAAVGLAFSVPVHAGPIFDEMLNYAVVDQTSTPGGTDAEGIVLVANGRANAQWTNLTRETPIGQTFRVGANADQLWRVLVGLCHWPDCWGENEAVTFTLYDSPEKKRKLYTRTIPYANKSFKWDTAFDIMIPTKPETSYYFELTHNGGGNNLIPVVTFPTRTYDRGQSYLAGKPTDEFQLSFTVITKPKGDRAANLRRFIEKFDLDREEMAEAKAAYERGDLDAACAAILKAVENRLRKAEWPWRHKEGETMDAWRVDRVIQENRLYRYKDNPNIWMPMDRSTTWREAWLNTTEVPRPNDLFSELGRAYAATGNEEYAKKLSGLMMDFAMDNPAPRDGGMHGLLWLTPMHMAWRLGDAWDGWVNAIDSRGLSDDVKLGWLDYWHRKAVYAQKEGSYGNHATAVGESLMSFAQNFPIFKESWEWFSDAYEKLMTAARRHFRPDGALDEPAMNYHGFALVNLLSGIETGRELGVEPDEDILGIVERALSYTAHMMMPDGQPPTIGDTDCQDFRATTTKWDGWRRNEAMKGYTMFGREDMLWVATAGKEGKRPEYNSYKFPDTRHYILRSGWGGENGEGFEDERWLFLRGGHMGSHGHWDMNQILLYAYGRPLIFDPGRTSYHNQELMRELTSSRSSSGLLVEGLEMHRQPVKLMGWATSNVLDLVDNYYESLYPGVSHRRAVFFVRPYYYIVIDTAVADQQRRMGLNWWLVPPDLTINQDALRINTNCPDGSNLLIASKGASPITIADRKGTVDLGGIRNDIPVATFWQEGQRADFATILYPYPAGKSAPGAEITSYSRDSSTGRVQVVVKTPEGTDTLDYLPRTDGQEGDLLITGSLVRQAADGRITSFAVMGTGKVTNGDHTLFSAESSEGLVSVEYLADRVRVASEKQVSGAVAATLGRTRAEVNGKSMEISGETFKPFD